jgi:hypothetical protein
MLSKMDFWVVLMKMANIMNNLFKALFVFSLFLSFNAVAQKTDVRVEIYDLKEDVKKLKIENQKLSDDLSTSTIINTKIVSWI